jgi:hypothetical protein
MDKLNRKGTTWCPNPTGKGGWRPGQSGNPGGMPKGNTEVIHKAREHSDDAIAVLVRVMNDPKASATAQANAAVALLNRAWGQASQSIDLSTNAADELKAFLDELGTAKLTLIGDSTTS